MDNRQIITEAKKMLEEYKDPESLDKDWSILVERYGVADLEIIRSVFLNRYNSIHKNNVCVKEKLIDRIGKISSISMIENEIIHEKPVETLPKKTHKRKPKAKKKKKKSKMSRMDNIIDGMTTHKSIHTLRG